MPRPKKIRNAININVNDIIDENIEINEKNIIIKDSTKDNTKDKNKSKSKKKNNPEITLDNLEIPTITTEPNITSNKIFIVDTSVILNNAKNLYTLSQNNNNIIIIPEIVLDEIDGKKKGYNDASYQAREFNRLIDQGKVLGKIHLEDTCNIEVELPNNLIISLFSKENYIISNNNENANIINDRKILEVATFVNKNKPNDKEIIVVSNDIALRSRAISLGLNTQPLMKDRVEEPTSNLIEIIEIESKDKDLITKNNCSFYNKNFSNFTNVVFICTDTNEQILTFYKFNSFYILDERKLRSLPVKPKNKEQLFFLNMLLDKDVPIVVCSGVSGSGKNLLTLVGALDYNKNLNNNKKINSGIKYCRNTITAGDKDAEIGFLKGNEAEKLSVFTYPLIDSINNYIDIVTEDNLKNKKPVQVIDQKTFMENNNISILNINQLRGSNVHGFVILDEMQNTSVPTTKLILTRINEGSKVIILGDVNQIDNANLSKFDNGLAILLKFAKTNELVGGINLTKVQRGRIADFAEKNL